MHKKHQNYRGKIVGIHSVFSVNVLAVLWVCRVLFNAMIPMVGECDECWNRDELKYYKHGKSKGKKAFIFSIFLFCIFIMHKFIYTQTNINVYFYHNIHTLTHTHVLCIIFRFVVHHKIHKKLVRKAHKNHIFTAL